MFVRIPQICLGLAMVAPAVAMESVWLENTPDYSWHAGCFGTASGNLAGYWDRNGYANFYTGPTSGGVAPLTSTGNNWQIRSIWASEAGLDGRPADKPGHMDDYWDYSSQFPDGYESTLPDPYVLAARAEHEPDCTGDFMGSSQNKYADFDGECSGNINAFSFNYWDKTGARRKDFEPPMQGGVQMRDIQSGLRKWAKHKESEVEVFSQLTDFNPQAPIGTGFTFADLKAEIDAGYPVMLFLQDFDQYSRSMFGNPRANPSVHAMLAYGYLTTDTGANYVRYKTSWASGEFIFSEWGSQDWQVDMPLRGVIGFHPKPKITSVSLQQNEVTVKWEGPRSVLYNEMEGTSATVHHYILEATDSLEGSFQPISDPLDATETSTPANNQHKFFRVRLVNP